MKTIILSITWIFLIPFILIVWDGLIQDNISPWSNYGVIYGNKVHLDWTPSDRLQSRLDAGHHLYKSDIIEKIIVSWWIWIEWYDEAVVMKDYLVNKWITQADIIIDSNWYTTQKTSENAWNLLWDKDNISFIWISQFFHISRVKLSLRKEWFKDVSWYAPRYFELRDIYSLLREFPAYIKYLLN